MNKSSTIWIIATLCVIIVLTAFGVVTNRMIQKDVQHSQKIVDTHREGRIRLAMWRLDTLAASIIANEDERSAYEFSNPELDKVSELNPKLTVNPLYYRTPETTNLYWNLEPSQLDKVSSPQVYNDSYLLGNSINAEQNLGNSAQFEKFKQILVQQNITADVTNDVYTCQIANVSLVNWDANNGLNEVTLNEQEQDFSYNSYTQSNNKSVQQIEETINDATEQNRLTLADQSSRQKAVSRIKGSRRNESWSNSFQLTKEKLSSDDEKALSIQAPKSNESNKKEELASKGQQAALIARKEKALPSSATKLDNVIRQEQQPTNLTSQTSLLKELSIEATTHNGQKKITTFDSNNIGSKEPSSTPFTPVWLNDELMLVRKVSGESKDTVQGIWLNKEIIINKLLSEIYELFPHAELMPVKQDLRKVLKGTAQENDNRTTTMLSIPLRLVHNDLQTINVTPTDYIKGPIGLAWLGALLAIGACYYMLKSVLKMAERRASFVSSVTHELRTPLTTFRLYSDLLSSGMVTDEEKQKSYLNTLKLESERLTHLVENVLSYSQIEKGSAKAKVESISLYQFIQRIEPRLNERATEEDMIVNTIYSESSAEELLEIDTTGVEQIIFNLVDNACKYASAEEHGREITFVAEVTNKKLNLKICDQGDGIAKSEQKRLFKPFHKSAKEAAHTKPGVGLGLALCKRLAKAMNGDLSISKNTKTKGACFQLTLPK